MNTLTVKAWALALAAIGISICVYKNAYLGLPLTPQQHAEVWTVQAQLSFTGTGGPAKASFYIPEVTPGFLKLDEDFISSRFGLVTEQEQDNRRSDWAIRRAPGQQTLYYRISVAKSNNANTWHSLPSFPPAPEYPEPYASAVRSIIEDVRNESADVASYTRELLQQLNSPEPNENVELIRDRAANNEQWVQEIIEILKGVRIPARQIWGVEITDAANNQPLKPLLQVHNGRKWLSYHPVTGEEGIPSNYLVWKIGPKPIYLLEGGGQEELRFSVTKTYEELIRVASQGAKQMDSFFADFSLMSLPVQNQNVYHLLLMVPLGALLVVILRTFVGINTFGTFMPVLIAIAFRETQLFWGLVLFTLIVSLGLMIRFYLERLMLLLVPRLASILVIVVILMLLVSLITNKLGADRVLSIALFPMVIMAMTIERMSITWEESGAQEAILQGLGSLAVACIGYLVMTDERLAYLMFVFPELLLVILSLCLLMGRYTGYRMMELRRFRSMLKQENKP